jgi:hypothetical protein
MDVKRCYKCGKKAIARVNGKAWVCDEHATEATIISLKIGQPVIWASRGDPQYMLMPTGGHNN